VLSPSALRAIYALPTRDRQQRKIANLTILTPPELQELVVLRDLLLNDAENLHKFGKDDSPNDGGMMIAFQLIGSPQYKLILRLPA
jgi:hypothetical protein